jgi:hypothetical protein
MADKGWISRVATAAGAAAGTGAAQLGLGYGLGVIVWPLAATTDDSDWLGSLSWATWITASATVFGAVLASRLGGGPARRWSGAWRLTLAASAAVGALVAVALIALPARSAVRDDAFSPQVTAGGYALLGVLFGLIVAYFAVASKPIAANLMATGVLLWGLAITAIVVELAWHRDSATYLTSWQFAQATDGERFGTIFWPSALLTLAAAFLIAAIAVIPAIRRGNRGLGAAVSGVVGPLLVAVAFLALAPRLTGALGPLESAYLIAPYAVLAGLAGSALAVTIGRAAADRRSRQAAAIRQPPRHTTFRIYPTTVVARLPTTPPRHCALRRQAHPRPSRPRIRQLQRPARTASPPAKRRQPRVTSRQPTNSRTPAMSSVATKPSRTAAISPRRRRRARGAGWPD